MKFDDLDKKMEKWHNRIFPTLTLIMFVFTFLLSISSVYLISYHFSDMLESWNTTAIEKGLWLTFDMFTIIVLVSAVVSPVYFIYTRIFTKFHFPSFDVGGGRKPKKTISPFGV